MASRFDSIELPDCATIEILRKMTAREKLDLASRMWQAGSDLMFDLVAREHPDWRDEQIQRETARRLSAPDIIEWSYKNVPLARFLSAPAESADCQPDFILEDPMKDRSSFKDTIRLRPGLALHSRIQ